MSSTKKKVTSCSDYLYSEFEYLSETWKKEKVAISSSEGIVSCDSYRKIIKMGNKVLPLIIDQLKKEKDNPDHWFVALAEITNEDPVSEEMYGDMVEMSRAWISWAKKNNVK